MMPAPPAPATARPPMNMLELTATAQRRDPSSKMAKKAMNDRFSEKDENSLPPIGCNEHLRMKISHHLIFAKLKR
jgi:hypothetical protein